MFIKWSAHFKNLAANAVRYLKYAWLFWETMHERVNIHYTALCKLIGFPWICDVKIVQYIVLFEL